MTITIKVFAKIRPSDQSFLHFHENTITISTSHGNETFSFDKIIKNNCEVLKEVTDHNHGNILRYGTESTNKPIKIEADNTGSVCKTDTFPFKTQPEQSIEKKINSKLNQSQEITHNPMKNIKMAQRNVKQNHPDKISPKVFNATQSNIIQNEINQGGNKNIHMSHSDISLSDSNQSSQSPCNIPRGSINQSNINQGNKNQSNQTQRNTNQRNTNQSNQTQRNTNQRNISQRNISHSDLEHRIIKQSNIEPSKNNINRTILLCYGQSGSGKTTTILGECIKGCSTCSTPALANDIYPSDIGLLHFLLSTNRMSNKYFIYNDKVQEEIVCGNTGLNERSSRGHLVIELEEHAGINVNSTKHSHKIEYLKVIDDKSHTRNHNIDYTTTQTADKKDNCLRNSHGSISPLSKSHPTNSQSTTVSSFSPKTTDKQDPNFDLISSKTTDKQGTTSNLNSRRPINSQTTTSNLNSRRPINSQTTTSKHTRPKSLTPKENNSNEINPCDSNDKNIDHKNICSSIVLIDLAGSENNRKTNYCPIRLKESCFINKSLFNLNQCMKQLRYGGHVPWRGDTLTKKIEGIVQQPSTGDILMILLIHLRDDKEHMYETINTMRFSELAKGLKIEQKQIIEKVDTVWDRLHRGNKPFIQGLGVNSEHSQYISKEGSFGLKKSIRGCTKKDIDPINNQNDTHRNNECSKRSPDKCYQITRKSKNDRKFKEKKKLVDIQAIDSSGCEKTNRQYNNKKQSDQVQLLSHSNISRKAPIRKRPVLIDKTNRVSPDKLSDNVSTKRNGTDRYTLLDETDSSECGEPSEISDNLEAEKESGETKSNKDVSKGVESISPGVRKFKHNEDQSKEDQPSFNKSKEEQSKNDQPKEEHKKADRSKEIDQALKNNLKETNAKNTKANIKPKKQEFSRKNAPISDIPALLTLLNTSSHFILKQRLNGIGDIKANRIIEYRKYRRILRIEEMEKIIGRKGYKKMLGLDGK